MKKLIVIASLIIGFASCNNNRSTGNGADDKPEKGPYQYKNDESQTEGNTDSNTPQNADSIKH